jgi:hypothetical protein
MSEQRLHDVPDGDLEELYRVIASDINMAFARRGVILPPFVVVLREGNYTGFVSNLDREAATKIVREVAGREGEVIA